MAGTVAACPLFAKRVKISRIHQPDVIIPLSRKRFETVQVVLLNQVVLRLLGRLESRLEVGMRTEQMVPFPISPTHINI